MIINKATESKFHVVVTNIRQAWYHDWLSSDECDVLIRYGYEVKSVLVDHMHQFSSVPTTEDIIADVSHMLVFSQYGYETDGDLRLQADAAVWAVRDTLIGMCEALGQEIYAPPTKAMGAVLDVFTRSSVQRMHVAWRKSEATDNSNTDGQVG